MKKIIDRLALWWLRRDAGLMMEFSVCYVPRSRHDGGDIREARFPVSLFHEIFIIEMNPGPGKPEIFRGEIKILP